MRSAWAVNATQQQTRITASCRASRFFLQQPGRHFAQIKMENAPMIQDTTNSLSVPLLAP
jgi:hypothetical protein